MSKRQHIERQHRRELQDAGFRVDKPDYVAFNSGSETFKHAQCKFVAAWSLHEQGYRVASEVEMPDGEIDVLGYATEDKDCIAVECETSPTEEVIKDKLDRYVYNQPVRDMFLMNVNEMPLNGLEATEWVRDQL